MISKKRRFAIILISISLLIFILLSYFYKLPFDLGLVSKQNLEQKITKLYELTNPGSKVEVVSIKEESGLNRVLLKITLGQSVSYKEVIISKDGKLLTLPENTVNVDELIEQASRLKVFIDCLDIKNVKIYGLSNDTATILQFNILGRLISSYPLKLFVPCDGNLVQNCILANVSLVPSIVINNKVEPGIKDLNWFENVTGCKF